jgi:hypothetical protein
MPALIRLEGYIFGKLTVISRVYKDGGRRGKWKCKCECGNFHIVSAANLSKGNTTSCGCDTIKSGSNHANWSGYEEIPGRFWGNIVSSAQRRGHEFLIDKEYAWKLFILQNRLCAISGIPIVFGSKQKFIGRKKPPKTNSIVTTASIDRIDSKIGYVVGNIQWVHKDINIMKHDYDQDYFIGLCIKISEFQK